MPPKPGTMVIVSHPDDESLWLGGTIACRARQGVPVDVVCCTRGETGRSIISMGVNLALVRLRELHRACKILGVRNCFFLDLPDGRIKAKDSRGISGLSCLVRLQRPKEVITFGADGITGHRDHRALHKMVISALKEADRNKKVIGSPCHRPETLKYVVLPSWVAKKFKLKYGNAKDKNIIVSDVSYFLNQKKRAIACHMSQLAGFNNLLPKDSQLQNEFLSLEYFKEGFI